MRRYSVVERIPTLDEFIQLRRAVGWGEADRVACATSLQNSLYCLCVLEQERVIGCGRIIGDGGLCFYIQDLIVLPAYQGFGLGSSMMDHLMEYLNAHLRSGSFVGLMAAKGSASFYTKYGFFERPTSEYGPGMILFHQ